MRQNATFTKLSAGKRKMTYFRCLLVAIPFFFALRAVIDVFAASHVLSLDNASPFGGLIASRRAGCESAIAAELARATPSHAAA
jgi:hypothetical protein